MPAKSLTTTIEYEVGSATAVDISVTVGDFQAGAVLISWGAWHHLADGETLTLSMGGGALKGEEILVIASVSTQRTPRTSVVLELAGGRAPRRKTWRRAAPRVGDLVTYMITVRLT